MIQLTNKFNWQPPPIFRKNLLTNSRSLQVPTSWKEKPSMDDQDTTTTTTPLLSSPHSAPTPSPTLRATRSAAFKRDERRRRKARKRQERLAEALCRWDPLSSSSSQSRPSDRTDSTVVDTPWPCDPDPPPPANSGSDEWAPFVPPCAPAPPHDVPIVCAQDVQICALRKCRSLFLEEEEGESGGYVDEEGQRNDRVLGFFSDLFRDGAGLRSLYEERRNKGVLVCLVCEKKFGSCISLLHHASTVLKTKQRQAHRVYGFAISQVLGLETNQIPGLGLGKGDASGLEEDAELDWEEMEA